MSDPFARALRAQETPQPEPRPGPGRSRLPLHVFLFVATLGSTFFVQYLGSGRVSDGIAYATAIVGILLAHEMGHYVMCVRHGVGATLPYFIPMPLVLFGTMGAVIRMRGPIRDRRVLFDIAVAGPIAGLAVAIPALYAGLRGSNVVPAPEIGEGLITLGEPLLLQWLSHLALGPVPDGSEIVLGPMAFAGWAGLFVTALNLIPAGQLDGGHVIYALFGRRSRYATLVVLAGMIALGVMSSYAGWFLFALLVGLFGFRHPPTLFDARPLDPARAFLGIAMIGVFALCFTPVPLALR